MHESWSLLQSMYWFWMCFWYLWIFVFSISCLNYYAKVSFGFLLIQFYFNLKWVCLLIVLYICLRCWNVDCPQCWLQKLIFVCQITFQKLENHGILSALWMYFFQHLLNICLCQAKHQNQTLLWNLHSCCSVRMGINVISMALTVILI